MNILFCSPTRLDASLGAPKVIIELAEGLRHLGCTCELIGPQDIDPGLIDARHDPDRYSIGLRNHLLMHAGDYDVVDYDHEYLPYDRAEFPSTVLMVARSVLLHYHFQEIKIPHPMKLKSVAGRMVRHFVSRSQHRTSRWRADKTGKEADLFLTLNSHDKQALIRAGYDESKIAVVGLGFHPQRFAALANANVNQPRQIRIGFVGTFDYRKGCLDMPSIVKQVTSMLPGTQFRLIGTAGLFKDEREVLSFFPSRFRPVVEVVPRFLPQDLPRLLDGCSAGIFPSYIEGFGFGVLEMLAAGMPVFAYDAPGPPDMLPAKWLSPRGDVTSMSRSLIALLTDSVELNAARIEARMLAESFTWSRAARQTLDAYSAARTLLKNDVRIDLNLVTN